LLGVGHAVVPVSLQSGDEDGPKWSGLLYCHAIISAQPNSDQ
jgi:hypothetical protein